MPNARPQWRCQAPQPRSGAPKAQGLIAALWSQHNPACRRSLQTAAPTQTTFTGAVALMATSAPAVKLHLLDGRDPQRGGDKMTITQLGKACTKDRLKHFHYLNWSRR